MMRRAASIAVLCAPWLCLHAQQVPTFTSRTEAVRVDVLVSRGGHPVLGLSPSDFEVRDDGVLQQVDHAAFEEIPLNVVLALDASTSVAGERMRHLRAAGRSLLSRLKEDDQAALVTFGTGVVVNADLTRDRAAVLAALDGTRPFGDTSLVDAAEAAILVAESQPGRALVIVFSDGVEVTSYLDEETVVDTARRSDAVVYGVSLRNLGPFLRNVSDASGGEMLEIRSIGELDGAFARILDEFRHRYLLSYTPRNVKGSGWHKLEVRVKARGVTVRARPGYLK